jgi:coenzyme F420-reducing hydrogenase alpha subunit
MLSPPVPMNATYLAQQICMTAKRFLNTSKDLIHGRKVDNGVLITVEMAIRAYHTCCGCTTLFGFGPTLLTNKVYDS